MVTDFIFFFHGITAVSCLRVEHKMFYSLSFCLISKISVGSNKARVCLLLKHWNMRSPAITRLWCWASTQIYKCVSNKVFSLFFCLLLHCKNSGGTTLMIIYNSKIKLNKIINIHECSTFAILFEVIHENVRGKINSAFEISTRNVWIFMDVFFFWRCYFSVDSLCTNEFPDSLYTLTLSHWHFWHEK